MDVKDTIIMLDETYELLNWEYLGRLKWPEDFLIILSDQKNHRLTLHFTQVVREELSPKVDIQTLTYDK